MIVAGLASIKDRLGTHTFRLSTEELILVIIYIKECVAISINKII